MRSFSEIETAVKRATRGIGFSWGVAEEVGKNIRLLEMFGLPGFKNINQYFKVLRNQDFEKISTISTINNSKSLYCPITMGLNFFDQSIHLKDANNIQINNLGFPLLFIPFVSRTSEIIGKRIFLKIDNKEFLFNFNQAVYSNYLSGDIVEKGEKTELKFMENNNLFSEEEWSELYKLSEDT
jgi:hypothetical protein